MGAWIEIDSADTAYILAAVAPLVGAWIEILLTERTVKYHMSLPLWERGLK